MISVNYIERINSIAHQSMKISKWIISLIFLIQDIMAYLNNNNNLYTLHKRHIKHNAKNVNVYNTVHKITHLVKNHTQNVTWKSMYRLL